MFTIGNEQLGERLDEFEKCPHCGEQHEVLFGEKVLEDGTKEKSNLLAYVNCGDTQYLVGISGKRITK